MAGTHDPDRDLRSIRQARQLARGASTAAAELAGLAQDDLDRILDAMQAVAVANVESWARLAVEETGFGNFGDKILKNRFASQDLHAHIRPMKTIGVIREDSARGIVEIAAPVGVVAAIIPSTNPTSTAIYKIFISIKAGNAIVLSPHPYAQRCVGVVADALAEAASKAGAPEGAISCMTEPALEGTNELMRHPDVGVILATGGTGLVRAAYSSGKPAFGVGPGNVPAFVDRSADVAKAARDIIAGKTFDNGVLCSSENAVIADRPIDATLREEMASGGASFLDAEQVRALSGLVVRQDGSLNTAIVGRDAPAIAAMAGLSVPEGTRCLVAPLEGVGPSHPLSREKLSPILAYYVEDGWEACCQRVFEVLRYGGMGHTMSIHSQDRELVMKFALAKPVFRICVNTPASVGAVGLTTGLEPSMTLGCGALGGNITSDNIMPRHLINLKRVAFEVRPFGQATGRDAAPSPPRPAVAATASARRKPLPVIQASPPVTRRTLRETIEKILDRKAPPTAAPDRPPAAAPAPRRAPAPVRAVSPAAFVSEADVREALRSNRRIPVDGRTIITPSARDLGEENHVFERT